MPLAQEAPAEPAAAPEPPPPEVPVEPEIVAVPEPALTPPLVAADQLTIDERPRRGWPLRAAWAVSVLVLLAGVWFAYSAKDTVMHAWPPSVRVYAALGLAARQ